MSNALQKDFVPSQESGGQMSKGQAEVHIDTRPQNDGKKCDRKSGDNKQRQSGKKSVTISDSQRTLKSFVKTPNVQNSSKQKQARAPPTPPQRDWGSKSHKK